MRQNLRLTLSTPVTGVIMVLELFPICLLLIIAVYCEDKTVLCLYYSSTIKPPFMQIFLFVWLFQWELPQEKYYSKFILSRRFHSDKTIIYCRLRSIVLRYKVLFNKVIIVIQLYIISFNLITGVFLIQLWKLRTRAKNTQYHSYIKNQYTRYIKNYYSVSKFLFCLPYKLCL